MAVPIQSVTANVGNATTCPVTLTSVGAGHTIIVYGGSVPTGRTLSVADTINGAYLTDRTGAGTFASGGIFRFKNSGAGSPVITLTQTGATSAMWVCAEEWGITLDPIDTNAGGGNVSGTSLTSSSTATLGFASELAVATCMLNGTSGGSFLIQSPWTQSPALAAGTATIAAGYYNPPTTAALTASFAWTTSRGQQLNLVTYQTGGVAVAPASQMLLLGVGS